MVAQIANGGETQLNVDKVIVTIQGTYRLEGALFSPFEKYKKYPGAILINGSGKEATRDGMIPIARYMAEQGFVTLCYDKRGTGKSEGRFEATGVWDLVEDVLRCLQFLLQRPEVNQDQIVFVGYSEGARLAVLTNAKSPAQGLVLIVPTMASFRETHERQVEFSYGEMRKQADFDVTYEEFKEQQNDFIMSVLQSDSDTIQIEDHIIQAKWIREYDAYDVKNDLPKVQCPVLVITGEKDLLCPPENGETIEKMARGEVEHHVIQDMTHALRKTDLPVDASNTMAILARQWSENNPPEHAVFDIIKSWSARNLNV